MSLAQGQVGPQTASDGTNPILRLGRSAEQVMTQLHGRFYEQALRGNVFTGGMALTSISNATFTTATTGATATPIIGLYNPTGSGVNAVLLQAQLSVAITALQATGCNGFAWQMAAAAGPISTGSVPYRAFGLAQAGSGCKVLAGAACTGMTGTLAVLRGSSLGGGSAVGAAFLATQVAMQTVQVSSKEDFDGSIILPPNSVIGLFCGGTPVAHSAFSGLVWEEVPV